MIHSLVKSDALLSFVVGADVGAAVANFNIVVVYGRVAEHCGNSFSYVLYT